MSPLLHGEPLHWMGFGRFPGRMADVHPRLYRAAAWLCRTGPPVGCRPGAAAGARTDCPRWRQVRPVRGGVTTRHLCGRPRRHAVPDCMAIRHDRRGARTPECPAAAIYHLPRTAPANQPGTGARCRPVTGCAATRDRSGAGACRPRNDNITRGGASAGPKTPKPQNPKSKDQILIFIEVNTVYHHIAADRYVTVGFCLIQNHTHVNPLHCYSPKSHASSTF